MDQENSPWQYKPDKVSASEPNSSASDSSVPLPKSTSPKAVAWQGTEYIDAPHGTGWYMALILVTIALAALVYLTSKDKIAAGIIVIVGFIVSVFAAQKPKLANYEVNDSGLSINGKIYSYNGYKSFVVVKEGDLSSINLFPLKRFMPPISAYFDPKDEAKIVQAIGNYLPYEDRKLDTVDRLARRLRL
jgi:hypothetical protein